MEIVRFMCVQMSDDRNSLARFRWSVLIRCLSVVGTLLMVVAVPIAADDNGYPRIDIARITLAARQGDVRSMDQLGILHELGSGVENKDRKMAKYWLRKASEQNYAPSQYNLAIILLDDDSGDDNSAPEAVKWLKKAAAANHPRAIHKLGELYLEGRGVPKSSEEAYKYFLQNSQMGIPASLKWLVVLWQNGDGVDRRPEDAARILEFLANAGDPQSQVMMGNTYDAAVGVEKDDKKAIEWYLKAARQGSSIAMNNLGVMMSPRLLNDNPNANVVKSFTWFNLAAGDGNEFAARQREKLRKHMTQEQIIQAERDSVDFIPKPDSWNDFKPVQLEQGLRDLLK